MFDILAHFFDRVRFEVATCDDALIKRRKIADLLAYSRLADQQQADEEGVVELVIEPPPQLFEYGRVFH